MGAFTQCLYPHCTLEVTNFFFILQAHRQKGLALSQMRLWPWTFEIMLQWVKISRVYWEGIIVFWNVRRTWDLGWAGVEWYGLALCPHPNLMLNCNCNPTELLEEGPGGRWLDHGRWFPLCYSHDSELSRDLVVWKCTALPSFTFCPPGHVKMCLLPLCLSAMIASFLRLPQPCLLYSLWNCESIKPVFLINYPVSGSSL